jgi:hypothetical protein
MADDSDLRYFCFMAYQMSRTTRLAGCGLMLGLFILLPVLYVGGGAYTEALPRSFNSAKWKSADHWGDIRCAMLADLRTRIGIEGKSKNELVELLGPDENETSDTNLSHWHLCPSFMDVWILEIRWEEGFARDSWVRDT